MEMPTRTNNRDAAAQFRAGDRRVFEPGCGPSQRQGAVLGTGCNQNTPAKEFGCKLRAGWEAKVNTPVAHIFRVYRKHDPKNPGERTDRQPLAVVCPGVWSSGDSSSETRSKFRAVRMTQTLSEAG
jgi:hypothetical protein